jgi:hypothetical protein
MNFNSKGRFMKKICLIMVFLLFAVAGNRPLRDSSGAAQEAGAALPSLASSWLYSYNSEDYDLMLHPYVIEEVVPVDVEILWDLNSDEVVNLHDFSVYAQIDMAQMIDETKGLQGHFTNDYFDALLLGIMGTEEDLGIENLRLFKILLSEADFDVFVYNYNPDWDFDFMLLWENETHNGWIDIEWDFIFGVSYTYTYKYEFKVNE